MNDEEQNQEPLFPENEEKGLGPGSPPEASFESSLEGGAITPDPSTRASDEDFGSEAESGSGGLGPGSPPEEDITTDAKPSGKKTKKQGESRPVSALVRDGLLATSLLLAGGTSAALFWPNGEPGVQEVSGDSSNSGANSTTSNGGGNSTVDTPTSTNGANDLQVEKLLAIGTTDLNQASIQVLDGVLQKLDNWEELSNEDLEKARKWADNMPLPSGDENKELRVKILRLRNYMKFNAPDGVAFRRAASGNIQDLPKTHFPASLLTASLSILYTPSVEAGPALLRSGSPESELYESYYSTFTSPQSSNFAKLHDGVQLLGIWEAYASDLGEYQDGLEHAEDVAALHDSQELQDALDNAPKQDRASKLVSQLNRSRTQLFSSYRPAVLVETGHFVESKLSLEDQFKKVAVTGDSSPSDITSVAGLLDSLTADLSVYQNRTADTVCAPEPRVKSAASSAETKLTAVTTRLNADSQGSFSAADIYKASSDLQAFETALNAFRQARDTQLVAQEIYLEDSKSRLNAIISSQPPVDDALKQRVTDAIEQIEACEQENLAISLSAFSTLVRDIESDVPARVVTTPGTGPSAVPANPAPRLLTKSEVSSFIQSVKQLPDDNQLSADLNSLTQLVNGTTSAKLDLEDSATAILAMTRITFALAKRTPAAPANTGGENSGTIPPAEDIASIISQVEASLKDSLRTGLVTTEQIKALEERLNGQFSSINASLAQLGTTVPKNGTTTLPGFLPPNCSDCAPLTPSKELFGGPKSPYDDAYDPANQALAVEYFNDGYAAYFDASVGDVDTLSCFTEAVRYAPKDPAYRCFLALQLYKMGQYTEAERQARIAGSTHMRQTFRVSQLLARVQGPVRKWLERQRTHGQTLAKTL